MPPNKIISTIKKIEKIIAINLAFLMISTSAYPCTGITLKSADRGVVVARTVEEQIIDNALKTNTFKDVTPKSNSKKK